MNYVINFCGYFLYNVITVVPYLIYIFSLYFK